MTEKTSLKGALILFLTAFIWGTAFVAQTSGMDHVGPFSFCFVRYFIGSFVLIPVILVRRKLKVRSNPAAASKPILDKTTIKGGIVCGVILFIATNLQQVGLQYTTTAKAGFLTALYILIVPILGIFMKRRVPARIWICVMFALVGLYLLCINGEFRLAGGDIVEIMCAVVFSLHIIVIDRLPESVDGPTISSIQFFVVGFLSMFPAFILEHITLSGVIAAALPILYAGVMSSGVAYTLQIVAQRMVAPTAASLIMSLESVISAISGWVILGQFLSGKELLGCAIMFTATCIAQIPDKKSDKAVE